MNFINYKICLIEFSLHSNCGCCHVHVLFDAGNERVLNPSGVVEHIVLYLVRVWFSFNLEPEGVTTYYCAGDIAFAK